MEIKTSNPFFVESSVCEQFQQDPLPLGGHTLLSILIALVSCFFVGGNVASETSVEAEE